LTQAATVGLYWSTDDTFTNGQDMPAITPRPTLTATGTHSISVAHSDLAPPRPTDMYLLAVIDPDNTVAESDETGGGMGANNVKSLGLPDIEMQSARLEVPTTQAPNGSVSFRYYTTGDPGPFEVFLYRSASPRFIGVGEVLVDAQPVTPSPTN